MNSGRPWKRQSYERSKRRVDLDVQVVRLLLTQEAIYTTEFWKKRALHFLRLSLPEPDRQGQG